jgi:hypothetical protein
MNRGNQKNKSFNSNYHKGKTMQDQHPLELEG